MSVTPADVTDNTVDVLHLITRLNRGGAEKTTRHEVQAISNEIPEASVTVGFGAEYDSEVRREVSETVDETVCFEFLRHYSLVWMPLAVVSVAVYLYRNDIDIIHTHSTEAGIVGRFAGFLTGIPVVVHEIHGDPVSEDRSRLLNQFVVACEVAAAWVSDVLVSKSENIRDTFLSRGIGEKSQYTVVRHGVDRARFENVESSEVSHPDGAYTVLFVGRVEDGKGLFDLLKAFDRVADDHDARLLIAGDGSQVSAVDREIESSGLSDRVRTLGYRDDIPALLSLADVLVLPSYREGTPRVITEAMLSETPVVATDIAGIPEQVTHDQTGYLVEPGDVKALSRRLDELLASAETRAEFGDRATVEAEAFSLEKSRQKMLGLYAELIDDL